MVVAVWSEVTVVVKEQVAGAVLKMDHGIILSKR